MQGIHSPASWVALACCVLGVGTAWGADLSAGKTLRVEPRPIDGLLANPGMGWQTFHRFADNDPNLDGLPSSSAYFRFYWREIEPSEGHIDFALFDRLLAHAHRAGQQLAFRVMCTGSGQYLDVPAWLKENGCRGVEFLYGGRKHWVPDFTDPRFQKAHFQLIRELGKRYDGNPDLGLVDIGSVGLWGEWHMSGTKELDTGKQVPLPPLSTRLAIIKAWRQAFPRTSLVVQIGSAEGMARAARDGYGWRADCLGDMGGFSKTWNHMEDFYLQQIQRTGAENAWKTGPVAFESCWDMRKWKKAGWDIHFIFDYALRCHVSYLNNKSAPIPAGTREEIEWFLRRMGYRLVLQSIEHDAQVVAGGTMKVSLRWINQGVAPPYRDDQVSLRLTREGDPDAKPIVLLTGLSIRGWLPGSHRNQVLLRVPPDARPGWYALAIGVVDHRSHQPVVRLAISGRDKEGWYPVSRLRVTRSGGDAKKGQ